MFESLQTQLAEVPFLLNLGRYQNTPFSWSENCCCAWTKQRRKKLPAFFHLWKMYARAVLNVFPVDSYFVVKERRGYGRQWVSQCIHGKGTVRNGYFTFSSDKFTMLRQTLNKNREIFLHGWRSNIIIAVSVPYSSMYPRANHPHLKELAILALQDTRPQVLQDQYYATAEWWVFDPPT